MSFLRQLSRRVLAVSLEETKASRRGFHSHNRATTEQLERIGREFLAGYHAALEEESADNVFARLNSTISIAFRGFAFEGAGMAFTLTDHLHLTRNRFADLLRIGDAHQYMLHVGAGWAWARLPWVRRRLERALGGLDPILRWLAVDGYGFHEGYFHSQRTIRERFVPPGITRYACRAFDQGVGRSLWFADGADPERIAHDIELFDLPRRADLWSGVGLACTYAGGVDGGQIRQLRRMSGTNSAALVLGCAFACEARRRAANMVPHTELSASLLSNLTADAVAKIAREESGGALASGAAPGYEIWRQRTQNRIANSSSINRTGEVPA